MLGCYFKLKLSHIAWLIMDSPSVTFVRVLWWGEVGSGALFRPVDPKNPQALSTQTALYEVRSRVVQKNYD